MNRPTPRLDSWIGKAAGALLLAFGLTASAILVLGTYRIVSSADSSEIATAVFVASLMAVAVFCLAVGYRLFLNRPNKYGSILTPLGWNALGAVFALLAIVGGTAVLHFGQYTAIAGPALTGVFAVCCFYAGRHFKART